MKQRVIISEFERADTRPRSHRRPFAGQQLADNRFDRHRGDVRSIVALGEQVPTSLDGPAVHNTSRADEHAAAMFAKTHLVEHRVKEPGEGLQRRQPELGPRFRQQIEDQMQDFRNRPGAHPYVGHRGVLRRDHLQVRHIDQREMRVPKR